MICDVEWQGYSKLFDETKNKFEATQKEKAEKWIENVYIIEAKSVKTA